MWVPIIEYATLSLILYYTLPFFNGPLFNAATIYAVLVGGYTLTLDLKTGILRCLMVGSLAYLSYQNVLAASPSAVWTWLGMKVTGTAVVARN